MGARPKIECPRCHKMISLDMARRHKEHPEICVSNRWIERWHKTGTHDAAGAHWRVLELAGLTKMWPIGQPKYARTTDQGYEWVPALNFFHVAPKWAVKLAKQLQDDEALARRIGVIEHQQRANGKRYGSSPQGKKIVTTDKKTVAVMAMWLRVRILRSCAKSVTAREFTLDDLETVALLLRDQ